MKLLEREALLGALEKAWDGARRGPGSVVVVGGDAGIGKTALVERFATGLGDAAVVLRGGCEPLSTPRPLGPLLDVARQVDPGLLERIDRGEPGHVLFAAFLDALAAGPTPVLVVWEDLHWADEATLDLVRFLGRRLGRVRGVLLVVTLRDDEVGRDPTLLATLGELARGGAGRLVVPPLSAAAVASLAREAGRPARDLHPLTAGNPFFVTEVLASPDGAVPVSVRDAVLGRTARLSGPARDVLEVASLVPGRIARSLLHAVLEPEPSSVDACVEAGVLRSEGDDLAFRHELARLAVEDAIPATRRRGLHRAVLRILEDTRDAGPARLAHHAERAGDADTVLRWAPEAAADAARAGAHREAARHYGQAVRHAAKLEPAARASLIERLSYELYLTGRIDDALESRRDALAIWSEAGDAERQGEGLRWVSRLTWFLGRGAEAARLADDAIRILETLPRGAALAWAYSNRAQLHMLAADHAAALRLGGRAVSLAEDLGDVEILSHALNNVGTVRAVTGGKDGWRDLERSLALALEHGYDEHAARAYTNLASVAIDLHDAERADRWLDEGIEWTAERDLDSWANYMQGWRSRVRLERGDWEGAIRDAEHVLGLPSPPVTRITALATLGRIRARRGDPGVAQALDEAFRLAEPTDEIQRTGIVCAARLEAAWLAGRRDEALETAAARLLRSAVERRRSWIAGDLAMWLERCGAGAVAPTGLARPYALDVAGKWRAAATAFARVRLPYESALALARGNDDARREALERLDRLGAAAAAAHVRRDLRVAGVRGLPRGPRRATREHPAGLTPRQAEILTLVAEGLSDKEIAARLCISRKTVGHHVSAVLAKLEARTRAEAAARGRRLGLVPET